eukprot:TRINITY_DN51085_c0_g1_i2.p2 TRINITY_DN51085_c0_g1~~TRINITY_DN51085_c0_g1_i2.p2  ORF type:complete len:120 (+),score=18.27 TRINITY_DN51085_c0_g1_i2:219-578(+)
MGNMKSRKLSASFRAITDILEHVSIHIAPDEGNLIAEEVANKIIELITKNNEEGKNTILALDSGNEPLDVYRELIYRYEQSKVDFSNVIVFALHEYLGIPKEHEFCIRKYYLENPCTLR